MMFCKLRRLELLRSGHMSDCELKVWYTNKSMTCCCRQFNCHKILLVSASEEFEHIFREMDFNKKKLVINVNDAMPDAYETLLLYIYTYEIYNDIKIDMFPDLVFLATKYKMPDFVDGYIGKFIDKDWPMSTVLKMFQLANEHNRPAMMKLVGKKIMPMAKNLISDNSFLKFNIKELHALMMILKSAETISDHELLLALKRYQKCNNLYYRNMCFFQQFVEVTHLFGGLLFEPDGTLAIKDDNENKEAAEAAAAEAAAAEAAVAAAAAASAEAEAEQAAQAPTAAVLAAAATAPTAAAATAARPSTAAEDLPTELQAEGKSQNIPEESTELKTKSEAEQNNNYGEDEPKSQAKVNESETQQSPKEHDENRRVSETPPGQEKKRRSSRVRRNFCLL